MRQTPVQCYICIEKEHVFDIQSNKPAIAFGLISYAPGKPKMVCQEPEGLWRLQLGD